MPQGGAQLSRKRAAARARREFQPPRKRPALGAAARASGGAFESAQASAAAAAAARPESAREPEQLAAAGQPQQQQELPNDNCFHAGDHGTKSEPAAGRDASQTTVAAKPSPRPTLLQQLEALSRCVRCKHTALTQSLECNAGHIMHLECWRSLPTPRRCPGCGATVENARTPMLFAKLVRSVLDRCPTCERPYSSGDVLEEHIAICPSRRFPCPYSAKNRGCQAKPLPVHELIEHLKLKHRCGSVVKQEQQSFRLHSVIRGTRPHRSTPFIIAIVNPLFKPETAEASSTPLTGSTSTAAAQAAAKKAASAADAAQQAVATATAAAAEGAAAAAAIKGESRAANTPAAAADSGIVETELLYFIVDTQVNDNGYFQLTVRHLGPLQYPNKVLAFAVRVILKDNAEMTYRAVVPSVLAENATALFEQMRCVSAQLNEIDTVKIQSVAGAERAVDEAVATDILIKVTKRELPVRTAPAAAAAAAAAAAPQRRPPPPPPHGEQQAPVARPSAAASARNTAVEAVPNASGTLGGAAGAAREALLVREPEQEASLLRTQASAEGDASRNSSARSSPTNIASSS